jgi:protein-disulfide isomerase
MKRQWIIASIIGLGLLGCNGTGGEGVERYRVAVGQAPARGTPAAKVTVMVYSDYQCPFCVKAETTMAQLEKDYGAALRVVWKDNPLPFHDKAQLAAEAARAAGAQGKYWPMHDLLIAGHDKLARADLEGYAEKLGLDLATFRAALDDHRFARDVQADLAEAATLGVRGTPTFFINGRPLRGALPVAEFKTVIDEEMASAEAALARGVRPGDVYDELTRKGLARAAAVVPSGDRAAAGKAVYVQNDDKTVWRAPVGRSAMRGPADAKVTVVVWSDFQCPFCSRLETTLAGLRDTYGRDLRIAFRNLPLPFHDHALAAAEAALAAGEQGRYWEMHDLLFANQAKLGGQDLEGYARTLNLDLAAFRAALAAHRGRPQIDEDTADAKRLGVNGTPTLFINGRRVQGALPAEALRERIDEELRRADHLLAQGLDRGRLYDALQKGARESAPATPAAAGAGGPVPGEGDPLPCDCEAGGGCPPHGVKTGGGR